MILEIQASDGANPKLWLNVTFTEILDILKEWSKENYLEIIKGDKDGLYILSTSIYEAKLQEIDRQDRTDDAPLF